MMTWLWRLLGLADGRDPAHARSARTLDKGHRAVREARKVTKRASRLIEDSRNADGALRR